MRLVRFNDSCIISRNDGVDKYDNEVVNIIYDGPCLYQEENIIVAQGVAVRRATLYIPREVKAHINDSVKIGNISAFISHTSFKFVLLEPESRNNGYCIGDVE